MYAYCCLSVSVTLFQEIRRVAIVQNRLYHDSLSRLSKKGYSILYTAVRYKMWDLTVGLSIGEHNKIN